MRTAISNLLVLALPITLCISMALCQTTVDATGLVRARVRNPTSGHTGSIGRKLPIRIVMERKDPVPEAGGKMQVDFILTNVGSDILVLPIWLHPASLEPSSAAAAYSVDVLRLYITSGKEGTVLSGGAELYGNSDSPRTLAKLAPNESVRVITLVAIPPVSGAEGVAYGTLVGHVVLDHQVVRSSQGQTVEDDQEVGYATSSEYPIKLVNKVHD